MSEPSQTSSTQDSTESQPSSSQSENLPLGWITSTSKSSGNKYYFNQYTGRSTYDRPVNVPVPKDSIHCSHILIKHNKSRRPVNWRKEPVTRTKEEALKILQNLRKEILKGEKYFATVAYHFSDCSSAKVCGDLGVFGHNEMQPVFEKAAFALELGQLSGIVDSASGVHIILRTG